MKGLLLLLLVIVLAIFAQVPLSFSFVLAEFQRSECKTIMWSRDVAIFEPPVPCSRNFTRIRKEYRSSLVYVQLESNADAGSDFSDCLSQKAWASKVLCGSLCYRSRQRSRACSTPSTFSCCSTTPAFSVNNGGSLADLSSSSNKSFAALRASSSIPYISGGGGGGRQAKRASVNEPSPEFPEQLKDFNFGAAA